MAQEPGSSAGASGTRYNVEEQTDEDKIADMYTVVLPGDVRVRLTARQLQIMDMPPQQKRGLSVRELADLGKILMTAQEGRLDEMLQNMDHQDSEASEYVDEPYEHKPLAKSTSIRLIRILPEDENGMLQIALDEYDLDEHIPGYHCLSYTWGNPHSRSPIVNFHEKYASDYDPINLYPIACNGRTIYVPQNLYDALQQLPDAPGLQLRQSYDFDDGVCSFTGLHVAVVENSVTLVKTNIHRGAEIDCRDDKGRTALALAAIKGFANIAIILLEAGADPQLQDYFGRTPLDQALEHDQSIVADTLLTFDPSRVRQQDRRNKHFGHGSKMWIDAICINQDDIEERSAQVRVMDRIYAQATHVTVWLGREDPMGGLAKKTLSKLWLSAASTTLYKTDIIPYRSQDRKLYDEAGIPFVEQTEWIALALLYLRQNFVRLWCLQEMVVPEQVVMYLGPHEIPWHEFMMVTEQLTLLQRKHPIPASISFRPFYSAAVEQEVQLITELRMRKMLDEASDAARKSFFSHTRRFYRGEDKVCRIPLLEMLMETITFQCSDPRDHIYGILALCNNHPESPEIEVDYHLPVEQLYANVMRLLLNDPATSSHPLRIVALIKDSNTRDLKALPSWVMDFGQPGVAPFSRLSCCADGEVGVDIQGSLGHSWDELLVEGMIMDKVSQTASLRPDKSKVSLFNFDPAWFALLDSMSSTYVTGQPRTEVLWRTLCADTVDGYDGPAPNSYAAEFRILLCAMILAHGEKAAAFANKVHNSPGGVLLKALMGLEMRKAQGSSEIFEVKAPTDQELEHIRDTSLTGPYYRDEDVQAAFDTIDGIAAEDGKDCQLPSRAEITDYLASPSFRIWRESDHVPEDTQMADYVPPEQDGFRTMFNLFNGGRRLFLTTSGYLGLGPMSMQQGDEVWLLKGSRVPFMLRRYDPEGGESVVTTTTGSEEKEPDREDELRRDPGVTSESGTVAAEWEKNKSKGKEKARPCYRYIGDLYVHGMMHGEGLSLCEDWEEITLV